MQRCTLHIGAHKTGSSSIQEALFYGVRHPEFQYAAGGIPNGSFLLWTLFGEPPHNQYLFKLMGRPGGGFADFQRKIDQQFQRAIRSAQKNHAELILSGEYGWEASDEVLTRIRQYLNDRGFTVQVVGYVRPWTPWIASLFAQRLRMGRRDFIFPSERDRQILDVRGNVSRLRHVFGEERVSIFKFSPSDFPQGCVVRHFCGMLGLPVSSALRVRANESLSLPAAQLLYSFNKVMGLDEYAPEKPAHYGRLGERLQHLPGPPLRLDATAVEPVMALGRDQNPWIERELGFSLADSAAVHPDPNAVKVEADWFNFSPEALEWLAQQTGQPVIRQRSGASAARAVARQVDLLRLRPFSLDELAGRVASRLRDHYVRWRWLC